MSSSSAPTEFRRATPDDAFQVATELFTARERVDMQTLAERLSIGRTTLYRWVGDREQLMGKVVIATVAAIWEDARTKAAGLGTERTLDSVGHYIVGVTADEGLRGFVEREPALALKVLLDPEGLVASALRAGLAAAMERDTGAEIDPEVYAVLVQVATALVWANVAGGLDPQVDAIVDVLRKVLGAHAT